MKDRIIEIPISGQFNRDECLWFLNRDFDDCMYKVYGDKVRRAFRSRSAIMLVDIYPLPDKLIIEWLNFQPSDEDVRAVKTFVSNWFDVDADLTMFYKVLAKNKRIAYMARKYEGLKLIGMPDFFEALCWCIIGQQINLPFAYKVKRKLVEQYGEFVLYEGEKYYVFPTSERLAQVDIGDLRVLQFSEKKAQYLIAISQAFLNGTLNRELLQALPDLESRIKCLTDIRGIGQWTANYALMKSLKEPSCIPHGDAGLINALLNHGIIKAKADKATIDKFFKPFAGWESYLVFYLWRTLSQPKE